MKIVVVGDIFVPVENMVEAAKKLNIGSEELEIVDIVWETDGKKDFQKRALNMEENGADAESAPPKLLEEIKDADILLNHFAPINSEVLEKAEKLKAIGLSRGGLDNLNLKMASEKGIAVFHVIRNAQPVAEFTVALILAETRNIARGHCALKNANWRRNYINDEYVSTMKNKTIGIIGMGNIGKVLVKKLKSFDVNIIAYDKFLTQADIDAEKLNVKMVFLDELAAESDIVSLHLRLVEETKNIIDEDFINKMKNSAYLINTSRAGLVKKKDLIKALENNVIAGAALDVFWNEPIAEDDPILELDNLTMTPHLAGTTVDAIPGSPFLLAEEINKFINENNKSMFVNSDQVELKL
jgi:D-3-phosphoglycerate dehydrogenase